MCRDHDRYHNHNHNHDHDRDVESTNNSQRIRRETEEEPESPNRRGGVEGLSVNTMLSDMRRCSFCVPSHRQGDDQRRYRESEINGDATLYLCVRPTANQTSE